MTWLETLIEIVEEHIEVGAIEGSAADTAMDCIKELTKKDVYLIMRTDTCVGNCALFWRPESKGYTIDIDRAGRFTKGYAREIEKNGRDLAVPISLAISLTQRHVDMCKLRNVVNHGQKVATDGKR